MPDATYTDAFGYPLSSISVLRRRRKRQPIYKGAQTQAAPGVPMPVTVEQVVGQQGQPPTDK